MKHAEILLKLVIAVAASVLLTGCPEQDLWENDRPPMHEGVLTGVTIEPLDNVGAAPVAIEGPVPARAFMLKLVVQGHCLECDSGRWGFELKQPVTSCRILASKDDGSEFEDVTSHFRHYALTVGFLPLGDAGWKCSHTYNGADELIAMMQPMPAGTYWFKAEIVFADGTTLSSDTTQPITLTNSEK